MANLGNTTIFGELKVSLGISSKNKTFLYDSLNQILKLTHISTIGGTNLDNGAIVIKSSDGTNTLALDSNEIISDGTSSALILGTVNGSNGISFRPQNTERLLVSSFGISITGAINSSGQIISAVATGTAPLVVSSTTKVVNLNADLLDGYDLGLNGNINTVALRGATIGNIQTTGMSTSWGSNSGVNTGGINVVMGTGSSATWLISGTNAGTYKGGVQLLDSGGAIRLFASTAYLDLTSAGILTVSGGFSGNGASLTSLNAANISTGTLAVARGGTGTTTSTGTGNVVLSTSPTLVTPILGVASGTSFNGITGLASTVSPMNGTATVGTSTTVARQDHVHASDTTKANTNQTMYIGTTSVA